jgi:hypothetical protein
MAKRKAYAPFSLTSEAGVAQTPVEGYIDVEQKIYPTVNTGTVNENGTWAGVKSSDSEFIGLTKAEGIANGGEVLFPDTNNHPSINCEGFTAIQFALKVSATGSYAITTVTGPDTEGFLNLTPTEAGVQLRITDPNGTGFENVLDDGGESIGTANAWRIFTIARNRLLGQINIQFKVTNNTGGNSDIEFAYRRLV